MTSPIATYEPALTPLPLLEVIRRKEAEVKRGLAAEREAAQAAAAEAEERARKLVAAAETEGRREGEAQRQAAHSDVEREAADIVAQARAQAEILQQAGAEQLEAAIARAVKFIVD